MAFKPVALDKLEEMKLLSFAGLELIRAKTYLIYGESLSGKTALCLSILKKALKDGIRVLLIDTEGKTRSRLQAIISEGVKKNLLTFYENNNMKDYTLPNFSEWLEKTVTEEKIDLIILDSIASPFTQLHHPKERAMLMKNVIGALRKVAQDHDATAIVTTHTYRKYDSLDPGKIVPIGGEGIKFFSDTKIWLRLSPGDKRILNILNNSTEQVIHIKGGLVEEEEKK